MKNKFILFLSCVALFTSCSDEDATNASEKKKVTGTIEVETDDVFASADYEFVLPRPFALAANFQEAGMKYDASRTNPTENVSNYNSKGAQLINFGVYSTDLVYNIMNEKPQQTMKYFLTIKDLAEKFGMGSIFTEDDLALEIEKNIADREMMEELLIEVHERSQEYLDDNDMRYLAAIQFAGAWIEGMYLVSFDLTEQDVNVVGPKLIDQMTLLKNTIHALEVYPHRDDAINQVLEALKTLQDNYNNFGSVVATGGKGMPKLTGEEIAQVAQEIQEIRKMVVELK